MYLRFLLCASIMHFCIISTYAGPAQLSCMHCRQLCAQCSSEEGARKIFLQEHKHAKRQTLFKPERVVWDRRPTEYSTPERVVWDSKPIYVTDDSIVYLDIDSDFEVDTNDENLNIVCKVQENSEEYDNFEHEFLNEDAQFANKPEFDTHALQLMDFKHADGEHNCPIAYFEETEDDKRRREETETPEVRTMNNEQIFENVTQAQPENEPSASVTKEWIDTEITNKTRRHDIMEMDCGRPINHNLPSGNNAANGQFPWIVRIAYRNMTSKRISYRCSGSMISDKAVLTAAHCVQNLIADLQLSHVLVGDNETLAEMYQINKVVAHPSYDDPKYANDIALIFIKNTQHLPVICLPINSTLSLNEELKRNTSGIFAGWSFNEKPEVNDTYYNGAVQFIRLDFVNNNVCSNVYDKFSENAKVQIIIGSSQLCAISQETEDVCQGDSGGPLMDDGTTGIYNSDGRYTLLGVVAFGLMQPRADNMTCGALDFPTVYTRVRSYNLWILTELYQHAKTAAE